jgi:hypothetical protein
MGERRDRRVPPAGRLTPTFLTEVERAAAGVPGASLQHREGYATVTIELTAVPDGLSERTRALVDAFPERAGRRVVSVDVRNRQWAAMVAELLGRLPADPA